MSPTYTFIGGDGRQYGPHPLETIQSWIGEGRLLPDTQMARSDLEGWFRAGDFQEFNWGASGAAVPTAAAATSGSAAVPVVRVATVARPQVEPVTIHSAPAASVRSGKPGLESVDPTALAEMRSHASWFYWIAGIWLVLALIEAFTIEGGAIGLIFTVPVVAVFALLGFFACRAHRWAFIVGLLLMLPFLALAIISQRWISVLFRCWAIYEVFKGFLIAREIRKSLR